MPVFISFWTDHDEAIVTTIIGIAASILFYYIAKKDGDKATAEYKRLYLANEKELKELKKKFEAQTQHDKMHHQHSVAHYDIVYNLNQKFESAVNQDVSVEQSETYIYQLLQEGKVQEAQNYFAGKKKLFSVVGAAYWESIFAQESGDFDTAMQRLSFITDNYTTEDKLLLHDIHLNKGQILENVYKEKGNALKSYLAAYGLHPSIVVIAHLLACYSFLGDLTAAQEKLEEGRQVDPENAMFLNASAMYFLISDDPGQALAVTTHAEKVHGFVRMIALSKAKAFAALGEFEAAIDCCRSILKNYPKDYDALFQLAQYYIAAKNLLQAEVVADQLHRLRPDDILMSDLRMGLWLIKGEPKKAIQYAKKFDQGELALKCPNALNILAGCYNECQQPVEARKCYGLILTIYKNYTPAMEGMLYSYLLTSEERDIDKAKYYCDQLARELGSENTSVIEKKGLIELFSRNLSEAIRLFESALRLGSESPTLSGNLNAAKYFQEHFQDATHEEYLTALEGSFTLSSKANPVDNAEYVKSTR